MNVPGKIVKVNDTHMHVYTIFSPSTTNQSTIVLLAGSGTACPTYDFSPLWHLLKEKYNVVVVERPGYGWSGQTERPRDIDTILEETRAALRHAGIAGPFIPAAHSLSGLEAIYWAQKYPNEISAIIGLDMSVPQAYDELELPKSMSLMIRLGHLFSKPTAALMVRNHPAIKNNILDEKERKAMQYIASKQLLSKNMVDEFDYVKENARKVSEGKCPQVPVLCFLSTDKSILKSMPAWGQIHRDYFADNNRTQFIELSCDHYVHTEAPEIIADSIAHFLVDSVPL